MATAPYIEHPTVGTEVYGLRYDLLGARWRPAPLGRITHVEEHRYRVGGKWLGRMTCLVFTSLREAEEYSTEHPPQVPTVSSQVSR
jgi:hypothetical protein